MIDPATRERYLRMRNRRKGSLRLQSYAHRRRDTAPRARLLLRSGGTLELSDAAALCSCKEDALLAWLWRNTGRKAWPLTDEQVAKLRFIAAKYI